MFATPPGYKEALESSIRELSAYVAIGTNIDPTAADDMTAVEGQFLPMSNVEQITDANYQLTQWMATFEGDGIKTAPDAGNLAPPIRPTAYPPQVGLWSQVISDGSGAVDFTVILRFGHAHTSAFTVYTYRVNVLEATASYYADGSLVRTATLVPGMNRVQDAEGTTYDRIDLHITKIDQPYSHVRIAEIEFGASETYGMDRLAGEITLVQEWDPTMQAIPLFELDFSLLNVLGDFDPDNTSGAYDKIRQNYPAELSFSVRGKDGKKYTVPCGRFMIASRKATDNTLDIVALDARSALSQNYGGLRLQASQSFGNMFTALFQALNIPFTVDEALFTQYPENDHVFRGEDYDLLTVMLFLEQYYDIWLVPERAGSIRVTKQVPADTYGLVNPEMMITYPRSDEAETFNYISVTYGPQDAQQEYVLDLRTDKAQLRSQIAILNPLVLTAAKAQEIARKVQARMYTSKVVTEWRGDPALDITDRMAIEGKWTEGSPTQYTALYQELTYDGGLSAETTTFN